jgi:hypothetical protein
MEINSVENMGRIVLPKNENVKPRKERSIGWDTREIGHKNDVAFEKMKCRARIREWRKKVKVPTYTRLEDIHVHSWIGIGWGLRNRWNLWKGEISKMSFPCLPMGWVTEEGNCEDEVMLPAAGKNLENRWV